MILMAPLSSGELLDRISILQLKCTNFRDPDQKRNAAHELELLESIRDANLSSDDIELQRLSMKLAKTNALLWDIESRIRVFENAADFGDGFVHCAREVIRVNDIRGALKKEISQILGSEVVEEKDYT